MGLWNFLNLSTTCPCINLRGHYFTPGFLTPKMHSFLCNSPSELKWPQEPLSKLGKQSHHISHPQKQNSMQSAQCPAYTNHHPALSYLLSEKVEKHLPNGRRGQGIVHPVSLCNRLTVEPGESFEVYQDGIFQSTTVDSSATAAWTDYLALLERITPSYLVWNHFMASSLVRRWGNPTLPTWTWKLIKKLSDEIATVQCWRNRHQIRHL